MIHNLNTAMESLRPNSSYVVRGLDYASIDWMDVPENKPTEEEVLAEIDRLNAEEPMKLLREERDRKLAETDWWVLPDRNPTQAQIEYRQALRDITINATPVMVIIGMPHMIGKLDPTSVTWPVKP